MKISVRFATGALAVVLAVNAPGAAPGWLGMKISYAPATSGKHGWVVVQDIDPSGPTAAAGVLPQDLVVAIDGKPVDFARDFEFLQFLATLKPGQKCEMTILRGRSRLNLTVTLGTMSEAAARRWQENFERARFIDSQRKTSSKP